MMKIVTGILISVLMLFAITLNAQTNENEVMNASTKTTFTIDTNGQKTVVDLSVYENRNYEMKWDKADEGKVDQDRTSALAKVTKLMVLDSNNEAVNDRYIVLRYDRQVTDTFEVLPVPNGFMVRVDKKEIKYVYKEGTYMVDTPDNDFFVVEEFVAK